MVGTLISFVFELIHNALPGEYSKNLIGIVHNHEDSLSKVEGNSYHRNEKDLNDQKFNHI